MSWLDDLLVNNASAASALLGASQSGTEHNTYGATGGALAPSETGPEQAATGSDDSPLGRALRQLVAGYQAWSGRHGGAADPLAARNVARPGETQLPSLVQEPVQSDQVTDPLTKLLAGVARVNTRAGSPRGGQAFQEYDLGGGQAEHVYYDKSGRRQVFKFRR